MSNVVLQSPDDSRRQSTAVLQTASASSASRARITRSRCSSTLRSIVLPSKIDHHISLIALALFRLSTLRNTVFTREHAEGEIISWMASATVSNGMVIGVYSIKIIPFY